MRAISLIAAAALATAGIAPSANAAVLVFGANLSGLNENPVNASPGSGFVTVTIDDVANTIHFNADFADLLGMTTAAHVHCCAVAGSNAPVAVGPGTLPTFPLGVTSGSYDFTLNLLDTATYTAGFVTNFGGGTVQGARDAIIDRMMGGETYFNVHSTVFPGGEIRGQLSAIPEPESWMLMIGGFALAGAAIRRRRVPALA